MNLIDERDKRTKSRKKAKDKFDRAIKLTPYDVISLSGAQEKRCTLSLSKSEGKARLLDEGAIVTANGDLDLYIKKGTIRKYLNGKNKKLTPRYLYGDTADEYFEEPDTPMNLYDRYEGSINVGHHDFATFPFVVGHWNKNDLSITNNGEGRHGLDVDVKLNESHPFVQAFRIQGIPLGVSVEMWLHFDDKATDEVTELRGAYSPVVDEIFISDFAIVGECGNVGSSDSIDFEGVEMKDNEMPIEESIEDVDEELTEEETEEELTEETDDKEDEAESEAEEEVEEEGAEEVESEEADDDEDVDEEDDYEAVLETVESLKEDNESLRAENESLKEENKALRQKGKRLSKKLKAKAEEAEKFMTTFKGLEISLGEKKEEETKEVVTDKLYENGDGRGVL